ncbi:MAG TPA: lipid II flippase MurJ [Oscillatoriaceae cyanobacterium]
MRAISRTTVGVWSRLTGGNGGPSANRQIFNAAAVIAVVTIVVKLVSMGKDQTVAAWFGAGDALDCFLIAYMLPSFVINVVGGSFNAALIPTYIRVREQEGEEAAHRLLSGVLMLSAGLLLATMLVLSLVLPELLPLLAHGFDTAKLHETQMLFYLLVPAIVINGLATLMGAVLNAGERFVLTAFTPMTTPVAAIAALLLFGARYGIRALAVGTVLGLATEFVVLAWRLHRKGVRLRRPPALSHAAVRQVIGQYVPMVAGACLMSGTTLVDQAMAAMLPAGSVATLNYGNKLVALSLNVGSIALGTAILPYFSKMVANSEWAGVRHVLRTYTKLITAAAVPLVAVLCLLSEPLVRLIFQHGAFTAADTHLVAQVQQMFLLQVPFYLLGTLNVRLISALRGNRILLYGAMISLPVDVVANWLGMKYFGIAGIALSTSIVYVCSYSFLSVALRRLLEAQNRCDEPG